MVTVLLPTSGTGSRLGNLTKYTNKSLVQLGDKLAICYIIEHYAPDTKYIILLGHYGNIVRDFLTLAYPTRSFTFIIVDLYEGIGSSLGYSLLQAKKVCQTPFFFHCCDTIISDEFLLPEENTLFVSRNSDYNSYASICVDGSLVKSIHKKGYAKNDYIYTGLAFIKNYKQFWTELECLYLENTENASLSDVDVHMKMSDANVTYSYSVLSEFYDTGNIPAIQTTKHSFVSHYNILEKNNESLCFIDDRVIKFIADKEVNQKRILRGQSLYPMVPKINTTADNFISMELVSGELLSECEHYGEIYSLLTWASRNLWIDEQKSEAFKKNCYNFYKKKTFDRLSALSFLKDECPCVNGITTGTIFEILDSIDFNLICTDTFTKFHGDFILDNIIKTGKNKYILLDWRHEFDKNQIDVGDKYYDLAKLRHNSIFNHKNISNHLYHITVNEKTVCVDLKCNYFLMKQLELFDRFAMEQNLDLRKIKILTSIIWLNMSSLYDGDLSLFLFYFGKLNLFLTLQDLP